MKFLSKLYAGLRKNLLKNQSGQGATEYILLLVVVVGMVIAFGPTIKAKIAAKTAEVSGGIDQVTTGP